MYMALPEITVEIRWFFPGVPEIGVKNWFLDNPRFGEALTETQGPIRSDLYLLAGGNTGIGRKLREGSFEIKLMQHQEEIIAAGGAVRGRGEIWHKWKWAYARAKKDNKTDELVIASFMASTAKNLRVMVRKKRWQRVFSPIGTAESAMVPGSPKEPSCWIQAELTELRVEEAPWWTLALEVYGNPEEPLAFLRQNLQWFLEDYGGPALHIDNSYSYPEWLAML
jgi:hypothetical protein